MLRWGIIGCGDIAAKRVIPAIQAEKNSELLAVSRGNTALLTDCAERYGIPLKFPDWLDLANFDDIDAVYIATPVYMHAEQTIAALEAGKHVLCEKPMAYDTPSARMMIDAAKRNDRKLGIAYYRRFYPMVQRIQEILREGLIGSPVFLRADNSEPIDPSPGEPRRWLLEREKSGGGPLMDMGCHRLDLFVHLFGEPEPAIRSRLSRQFLTDRDVEDSAAVQLDFPGGVTTDLFCSHVPAEPRDSFDIYGSAGSIHISVLNGNELILKVPGSEGELEERRECIEVAENVHLPLIADFVDAVESDRPPLISGEEGLITTQILDRVYGRLN